jgi:glyoxylase-like metal-dependent hydrolase (beta-lactamase superfamily II)
MPVLTKAPQSIFANAQSRIFAFPPNRETLGGTAYLIVERDAVANDSSSAHSSSESLSGSLSTDNQILDGQTLDGQILDSQILDSQKNRNILIDCPALSETNQAFIAAQGGIDTLFITHRGGMAQVPQFQTAFSCQVLIQEQEAYLLPTLTPQTFRYDHKLSPLSRVFWTPGHSPGSACLHHYNHGGVLFTGRHLIPNQAGAPQPLRLSKTFHWPRQLRYGQQLLTNFTPETLGYICPGGSTGFLRGEKKIAQAYQQLQAVDWESLKASQPVL